MDTTIHSAPALHRRGAQGTYHSHISRSQGRRCGDMGLGGNSEDRGESLVQVVKVCPDGREEPYV